MLNIRITLMLSRIWIFFTNKTNKNPIAIPTPIPRRMETGTCQTMFHEKDPPVAIVVKEVKRTITNTSSAEAPVMIMSGIPLSVPYPVSFSFNILGTTTAGETAAITQPNMAASRAGSFNINVPSKRYPKISAVAGRKQSRTAEIPFFLKSFKFRFNPARVKIMIRASFLKSADMPKIDGAIRFKT